MFGHFGLSILFRLETKKNAHSEIKNPNKLRRPARLYASMPQFKRLKINRCGNSWFLHGLGTQPNFIF